jgi:hypothetical protein
MSDIFISELKHAVESQHGGTATLAQSVPVHETFKGEPVWEGVVHVFDLEGHPKATRAYAWSSPIEGSTKRRFFAVLHMGGIRSPQDAVGVDRGGKPWKAENAMRLKIIPIAIFLAAFVLLAGGTHLIDYAIKEFVRWLYGAQALGNDINPEDTWRFLITTPVVRVIISLPVLATGLFVILAQRYEAKDKNWAYAAVGTLLGYWLKG